MDERVTSLLTYAVAIGASAAIHWSMGAGLSALERQEPTHRGPVVVEVVSREPPKPPKPPPPEVAPEPPKPKPTPPPPKKQRAQRPPKKRPKAKPRQPTGPPPEMVDLTRPQPEASDLPPPNQANAPSDAGESGPPVFGVTLRSVTKGEKGGGGGFRVRVGNTLMKEQEETFTPADEVKQYAYTRNPAPVYKITEQPRVLKQHRTYPEEAKRQGLEGTVKLEIVIDREGKVSEATVIEGPHRLLNQAAREALLKFRFTPAKIDGQPVAARIPWSYTFELDW